jgi:NADPH:quinone reductase-like Zn-dependent oxidoreductase
MKAAVHEEYGGPEVLRIADLPVPQPGPGEVLVRVRAASINEWDHGLLTGTPGFNRSTGLRRPRMRIIGSDIAGSVEAVGPGVKRFLPGDEVMGDLSNCGFGAFAEYACPPESALAHKPGFLGWEEAAAVPQAGLMAIGAMRKGRPYRPGQRVLINGAGGGVGTFAIQIAKQLQAVVTAVDRGDKLAALHRLGADEVIDYELEDFTRTGEDYDVIVDPVSTRSPLDYRLALAPGGAAVVLGGGTVQLLEAFAVGPLLRLDRGRRLGLHIHRPNEHRDLARLLELLEHGAVHPVIDRSFALDEAPAALQYYESGSFVGKIVLTMEQPAPVY